MTEIERARRAAQRVAARRPRALGLALDLRRADGARLRSSDDARGASLERLAIAVPKSEASDAAVLLLDRDLLGRPDRAVWLGALLDSLWGHASGEPPGGAPYVVFADAQRGLRVLADEGLGAPPRFGCVKTAITLLSAGGDRRRDHRPLERAASEVLGRELPAALLGPSPGAQGSNHERLACEAEAALELIRAVTPELRDLRLAPVYSFECSLVPAVVEMERAGVGVDAASFERVASGWVRERASLGETPEDPPRAARLDKLISTYRYWARDYVDPDRRIRCRLHPLAADSGRFSCTDPNLQQVPAEHTAPGLRACFVPAPGHRLIIADYAQIELRVAAHLAPCDALRAVFHERRDPHRATASNLAGKPAHEIDAHERKLAKAVNFGFLFGMGARRFRQYARDSYGLELDEREAERAREAFFRTFPGIAAWHRRVGALSRRGQREAITVTTAMGRRRTFPAGEFSFNAALNIPVQGTAAEGFKLAMLRLREALAEIGGRGVLVVHDEYLAEVPIARAQEGRAIVEREMVAAMASLVDSVPIVVEAEIAEHWA